MISENLTRPKLRKLKRKNILRQATQRFCIRKNVEDEKLANIILFGRVSIFFKTLDIIAFPTW